MLPAAAACAVLTALSVPSLAQQLPHTHGFTHAQDVRACMERRIPGLRKTSDARPATPGDGNPAISPGDPSAAAAGPDGRTDAAAIAEASVACDAG